ncbi:Dabb family protein [Nocardia rhizosphaerae]|uniref:Dabb family protein n=1 Tax=Nocardia rhizosphaerae TaxID=1691571 RepID=A0ABV8LED2_9NOCA
MYEVTRLIHFAADAGRAARARLTAALDAAVDGKAGRRLIQPTLPGVRNGGDVLAHWRFDAAANWAGCAAKVEDVLGSPLVAHVDGVEYRGGTGGSAAPGAAGTVYRTLLLRVLPDTPATTVRRFEADLLRMPGYIPAIRTWRLSTVDRAIGSVPWTHVWEQEFADLDGLTGSYLMHPIHWAHVDRWFDPECPEMIVRDRVCHSFCVNAPHR